MRAHATQGLAPPYDSEVRFGVVMYGGVSLAIYINGVANELYELACATPRPGAALVDGDGTRRVYRWLAALLGDAALRDECCGWLRDNPGAGIDAFFERADTAARLPATVHKRFVVDVISGTSAGGINGLFLAKALANREPFAPLRDLWIREGDIGKLINDEGSRADDKSLPAVPARPASLLNSDRMYRRLLGAMATMTQDAAAGRRGPDTADELDLFVTTTDIRGSVVGLRLADKLVAERRHRQVFSLSYRAGAAPLGRNDLAGENHAFLAYVARCTSSFPFAFEPMTLAAIERGGGAVGAEQRRRWSDLFARSEGFDARTDPLDRAYGDGGYLDNKPFGHAIDALTRREAELPVERKLLYIEPSPAHPEDAERARAGRGGDDVPDAVDNALAALLTIPRAETIREDLEAVLQRNRRIERVDLIVRQGEADLEAGAGDDPYLLALAEDLSQGKKWPQWETMTLADLRRYYGDAFLPYRRLRVYMTTDKLAERLAPLWGIDPESDHWYALRTLVRVWRERRFAGDNAAAARAEGREPETANTFLFKFDIRYRTRRLRFLLRRIDALLRLLAEHDGRSFRRPVEQMPELHQRLVARLKAHQLDLAAPRPHDDVDRARAALAVLRERYFRARDEVLHAELELPELGGAAAREQRRFLGPMLLDVLDRVLGAPGAPRDERDPRPRLGEHLPAEVAAALDRLDALPQVDRSLQERVVARARLLYGEMDARQRTALQAELEGDLEAIEKKIEDLLKGSAQAPALSVVSQLLGKPDWRFDRDGERLLPRVEVGDVGVAELDTPEGKIVRRVLGWYYLRYDSFDQMSLPLYYGTDTGEPATVDVIRISPEDATALVDERATHRRKLAGTAMGNFGGFLDEQWRRNDILWGRFDGAERLIHALLPAQALHPLRDALVDAAHRTIAREVLAPAERAQLGGVVLGALDRLKRDLEQRAGGSDDAGQRQRNPEARMRALLAALALDDTARRKHVERVVGGLFDDRGLLEYMRSAHDVDRALDPKRTMRHAARALTVSGRVLEGVAEGHDVAPLVRWMSRLGLVAQGVLAAAMPGSIWALVSRHWLTLLYLFEAAMVLLGTLFTSHDMRSAGLTAFAVTAITHATIVFARDRMREKPPWRSKVVWLAIALTLTLVAVGGWAVHKVPLRCLLPATQCEEVHAALPAAARRAASLGAAATRARPNAPAFPISTSVT